MIFLYALALIPVFYLLGKSADILLKGLAQLGDRLGLSKFILGFIILGFATSSPELFIAISSSMQGIPELSFGNLLGGIIVLFSFIIGLQAVFRGKIFTGDIFHKRDIFTILKLLPARLPFRRQFLFYDLILIFIIILVPFILVIDQKFSRVDGLISILTYLFYVVHSLRVERTGMSKDDSLEKSRWAKNIFFIIFGLFGLFSLSQLIVWFSYQIISAINITPIIFGMILLSFGTNLPEITVALRARHSYGDFAVGNVFGSAMSNIFIIGVLGILAPFSVVNWFPVLFIGIALAFTTLCLTIFLKSKDQLERYEGVVLIIIYFIYLIFLTMFLK